MKVKYLMLLIALYTFLFLPMIPIFAFEMSPDQSSPVIQYDPPAKALPVGKALKIEATIHDEANIKDVTVFYRKSGESNYKEIRMEPKGNDLYSATIPEEAVKEPGLEYYIQASDETGNIVMRGLAFSPLTIIVKQEIIAPVPSKPLVLTPSPEERMTMKMEAPSLEEEKPWYKKWWIWTIAGAVVIGAAAAGGHGGGGGGGGCCPPPPSGSAHITMPTP
jgi:hypothetical protein